MKKLTELEVQTKIAALIKAAATKGVNLATDGEWDGDSFYNTYGIIVDTNDDLDYFKLEEPSQIPPWLQQCNDEAFAGFVCEFEGYHYLDYLTGFNVLYNN